MKKTRIVSFLLILMVVNIFGIGFSAWNYNVQLNENIKINTGEVDTQGFLSAIGVSTEVYESNIGYFTSNSNDSQENKFSSDPYISVLLNIDMLKNRKPVGGIYDLNFSNKELLVTPLFYLNNSTSADTTREYVDYFYIYPMNFVQNGFKIESINTLGQCRLALKSKETLSLFDLASIDNSFSNINGDNSISTVIIRIYLNKSVVSEIIQNGGLISYKVNIGIDL